MFTILLIVLIVFALGGFGHTGYRRGWYGRNNDIAPQGGWHGGGIGIILVIIVLFLLFDHHPYYGP